MSPTLLPWLTSYYQNGITKCGTGERNTELTLLSWCKLTSSSHCQRPILIPSIPLDTDRSRIKYVNPNTDKRRCRELVQMPWGEGHNLSRGLRLWGICKSLGLLVTTTFATIWRERILKWDKRKGRPRGDDRESCWQFETLSSGLTWPESALWDFLIT